MTSEMRLQVVLDKKNNEKLLIQNVKELDILSENENFWRTIISDRTYSAAHRRVATVQYFIRHVYNRKVSDIKLNALNLQSSECRPEVMRMIAGVVPVRPNVGEVVLRIYFIFSEIDSACVYMTIPDADDSVLVGAISGTKGDVNFVITDVAAAERLHSGESILWQRWKQHQVYRCRDR